MTEAGGRPISARQVLGLLWASMLAAIGIYGAVSFFVAGSLGWSVVEEADTPRQIFTVLAIVAGVVSIWWRRRFLSGATPLSAAHVQRHAMVVWSLSETAAIFGLVLCFLTRNFYEFVPFGLAAAALLLLHRPSAFPVEETGPAME